MRDFLPLLAGLLPFLFLVAIICVAAKRREKTLKNPLTQRLLRPPGESLRKQIDDLSDKITEKLLYSIWGCVFIGIGTWSVFENWIVGAAFILLGLLIFTVFAVGTWTTGKRIRDFGLGFLGERAVGEELNQLLASGWSVFHDIEFHENPGQKPFNIDHVVVGTGGVFAIETKTRRKRVKFKKDDPKNEVIFNGSTLAYPWGEERFGVDQARQRAGYLARWIKSKLGDEVFVQPVLALPGWMVYRRAKSDLRVISAREIASLFRDEDKKQTLTPQTVKSITALLDQKCRDVEW